MASVVSYDSNQGWFPGGSNIRYNSLRDASGQERQTLLSYCREAKGAKALKAERAARVKAAADAAEQKLRDEEEQERELEKLANALGDRPRQRDIVWILATHSVHFHTGNKPLVKDKPKKKKPKPPRQPSKESSKENNGAKDAAAASKTKKGKK